MLMALHSGPIASTRSRTGRPRKRSSCHPSASANRHADGWNAAQALLPHLIMPAHHDVQSSNVFAPRLRGPWLQRPSAVRRLSRSAGVGARTVRSLARRTQPFPRPDADLAGTLRQGPAPLPGPDQELRRDDPRHEVSRPERKAWTRRGDAAAEGSRRPGAPALPDGPGPSFEAVVATEHATSPVLAGR